MNDFTDVVGVIEATSYETLSIYRECVDKGYEWKDGSGCQLERITHQKYGYSTCFSPWVKTINGHKILFLEPTSTIVDWDLIDKWIEDKLPEEAKTNRNNAMNGFNTIHKAMEKKTLKRGDRVKVNEKSGFNKGAVGTVEFVEPNGEKIWVYRDGSSEPCFFYTTELDHVK